MQKMILTEGMWKALNAAQLSPRSQCVIWTALAAHAFGRPFDGSVLNKTTRPLVMLMSELMDREQQALAAAPGMCSPPEDAVPEAPNWADDAVLSTADISTDSPAQDVPNGVTADAAAMGMRPAAANAWTAEPKQDAGSAAEAAGAASDQVPELPEADHGAEAPEPNGANEETPAGAVNGATFTVKQKPEWAPSSAADLKPDAADRETAAMAAGTENAAAPAGEQGQEPVHSRTKALKPDSADGETAATEQVLDAEPAAAGPAEAPSSADQSPESAGPADAAPAEPKTERHAQKAESAAGLRSRRGAGRSRLGRRAAGRTKSQRRAQKRRRKRQRSR